MKRSLYAAGLIPLLGLLLVVSTRSQVSSEGAVWTITFPDGILQVQTCTSAPEGSNIHTRDFFPDMTPADVGDEVLIRGKSCQTLMNEERGRIPVGSFKEGQP